MARNGSGTYSLPLGNPVVTLTTISSTDFNNTMTDLATALTDSIAKDGQTTPTANLTMGGFRLTNLGAASAAGDALRFEQLMGSTSPTQITSNQNDYNPTGLSSVAVLRLSSDAARDITGLAGGASTRRIVLANTGSFAITLKDESSSSSAANRFALSADAVIAVDESVELLYDGTSSRWRTVGGTPLIPLTVANGGTGATTLTGVVKGNGTSAFSAATAGTDYLAPPSGTAIMKANSGGALANATAGTDYAKPDTASTWSGIQTLDDGKLKMNGATSGTITVKAPAVASTYTITYPAATTTLGYVNLPAVGTKTGSYTLATADIGKYVQVGSGGSITIPDATFAEGDAVSIFNNTSGNITITCTITTAYIAGTDSDKATMTLSTRGVATILFISSTICVVTGNVS